METNLILKYRLRKYIATHQEILAKKDIEKVQLKECLGIERVAKGELVNTLQKRVVKNEELAETYPLIDPIFLTMQHSEIWDPKPNACYSFHFTLPQFCLYSLDSPNCRIKINVRVEWKDFTDFSLNLEEPKAPKVLRDPFLSSIKLESWRCAGDMYFPHTLEYHLSEQFNGFIPENAKSRIREAEHYFGNNLYVIAEAKTWRGKTVSTNDPLIIGVHDEECYLVTDFNCTSLEDYVQKEFK